MLEKSHFAPVWDGKAENSFGSINRVFLMVSESRKTSRGVIFPYAEPKRDESGVAEAHGRYTSLASGTHDACPGPITLAKYGERASEAVEQETTRKINARGKLFAGTMAAAALQQAASAS